MSDVITVVAADDSYVVRSLLDSIFSETDDIRLIETAKNGEEACRAVQELQPDILVLDIEMPKMDGLETLKALRGKKVHTKVIVLSTLTSKFAPIAMKALSLGATTYIQKPSTRSNKKSIEEVADELTSLIRSIVGSRPRTVPKKKPKTKQADRTKELKPSIHALKSLDAVKKRPLDLIVVASSTGGPNALSELLSQLKPKFQIPIAITQHMPKLFLPQLAKRLSKDAGKMVLMAEEGMLLRKGVVYVCPGDIHTKVLARKEQLQFRLDDSEPEIFCKPAANKLFRSAAHLDDQHVLGLVLTGMGEDGYAGSAELVANGHAVLAQDKTSSVIWSMPGIVVEKGLASGEMNLAEMADLLNQIPLRS